MKTKIAVSLAMALLSLTAAAFEPRTIVLADGSTASVLNQYGTTTTYLKEAKPGSDGKVQLVQGEVFDGERLVKKSDGQCLTVREHLVSLELVSAGEFMIQRPTTTIESKTASCNL